MTKNPSNFNRASTVAVSAAAAAREHALAGDLLYSQGQFQAAFERFQEAIRLQPDMPDYHFRVGSAAWKLDLKELVEAHYQEAARLDPEFAEAHKMLAQWFVSRGKTEKANHHSALAMAKSTDADTIVTRAIVLTADGKHEDAWAILKPLVESGKTSWPIASAYADVAGKIGHHVQAVAFIDRTVGGGKVPPVHARRLHVAAASLLEATGQYDAAFSQMRRAKALSPDTFDPAGYSLWVSQGLEYFTPRRIDSLPRAMHGNARPLLIVGMPRSGTSLLEQILASHPAVFGGGELLTLGQIANSLSSQQWAKGLAYPHCLDLLSLREADRFAAQYLAAIQSLHTTAKYVTDKMPQNYEWLGLAQVVLPQSRVIHCMRDPRDTCVSCFLTDFNTGNAFSKDLSHLAGYYRDYQRQMQHWKSVSRLPILDVRYEEIVSDPETQIRRILEFLNLPWDERCLAFHENPREVATASRDQVRRAMYSSSVGRWKKYEKSIGELLELSN